LQIFWLFGSKNKKIAFFGAEKLVSERARFSTKELLVFILFLRGRMPRKIL
jgi:hypothetical protein